MCRFQRAGRHCAAWDGGNRQTFSGCNDKAGDGISAGTGNKIFIMERADRCGKDPQRGLESGFFLLRAQSVLRGRMSAKTENTLCSLHKTQGERIICLYLDIYVPEI